MSPLTASTAALSPAYTTATQRHADWWSSRPGTGPLVMVRAPAQQATLPTWTGPSDPAINELDPAWHVWRARHEIESSQWLGDSVPRSLPLVAANLYLLAGLCGHRWHHASGTAWVDPVEGILDRVPVQFDADHPLIRTLDDCLRAMAEAIADDGFVATPPMLDGPTTLSQLMGGEAFAIALIEEPERIQRWLEAWTSLLVEAQSHFYRTVAACGCRFGSSWLPVCAPGRFEAVQCDAAVLMSPRVFGTLVMPGLRRQVAALDHSLYHLDGVEQVRFLDQLATIDGLGGIQWNPQPSQNCIEDGRWIDVFRRIRREGWKLHFNESEARNVEVCLEVVRAVGGEGLSFCLPTFADAGSAGDAYERIQAAARV
jgi:hypothetical protein